jgi:hypothetical protein
MANSWNSYSISKGKTLNSGYEKSWEKRLEDELEKARQRRLKKQLNQQKQQKQAKKQDDGNWFTDAAGAVGGFVEGAAKDLAHTTADAFKGGTIMVESPFKEHAANEKIDKANKLRHQASQITRNWSKSDFEYNKKNNTKAWQKVQSLQKQSKQLLGGATKNIKSDKIDGIDAKKLAFESAETALNIGTLGVGTAGKALLEQGVKQLGKKAFEDLVKQATKTGDTKLLADVARQRALQQASKKVLEKGTKRVAGSAGKRLAKNAGKDAVISGAYGAIETGKSDNPTAEDYLKNIGLGTALGVAFPVAGAGTRATARRAKQVFNKTGEATDQAISPITDESHLLDSGRKTVQQQLDKVNATLKDINNGKVDLNSYKLPKSMSGKSTATSQPMSDAEFEKNFRQLSNDYDKQMKLVQNSRDVPAAKSKKAQFIDKKYEKKFNDLLDQSDSSPTTGKQGTVQLSGSKVTKAKGLSPGGKVKALKQHRRDLVRQLQQIDDGTTASLSNDYHNRYAAFTPAQKAYYKNKLAKEQNLGSDFNQAQAKALESTENKFGNAAPVTPPDLAEMTPKIKGKPNPKISDKVKTFSSKEQVLRKTNTRAGNKLADRAIARDRASAAMRANWMYKLDPVMELDKKDFQDAWDIQEGKLNPSKASQSAQKGAQVLRKVMPQIRAEAVKNGADVGDLGKTYMPHHVTNKPEPSNSGEVHVFSDENAPSTKQSKFGHFEERTSKQPDYEKSKDVLQDYVQGVADKTSAIQYFGKNNKVIDNLLTEVKQQGGDYKAAKRAMANYLHSPQSDSNLAKGIRETRGFFSFARLPKAALSHAGQTSNTAVDTGVARTAKSWVKYAHRNPKNKDFVKKTGVLNPQSLHHYRDTYTSVKGLLSKATAPGLEKMLKGNRSVTALAYRDYAKSLAKKGNVKELRKLGVKGNINHELTEEQQIEAARGGVERTMYGGSRLTTPTKAETNWGKTIGQYRMAYAYPQTRFIYNRVIKEAGKGNLKPLARYLTVSALVAGSTVAAKNVISGRKESKSDVVWDVIGALGGLPGETLVNSIRYGKKHLSHEIGSTIAPVIGESLEIGDALQSAINGKPKDLERYGIKLIPFIGSRASDKEVPYTHSVTINDKSVKLKGKQLDKYNKLHEKVAGNALEQLKNSQSYKNLAPDEQQSAQTSLKRYITEETERKYGVKSSGPQTKDDLLDEEINPQTAGAFLATYAPLKAKRDDVSKKVTNLLKTSQPNKAIRVANQFNQSLTGSFGNFQNIPANSQYDDMMMALPIKTTQRAFDSRERYAANR